MLDCQVGNAPTSVQLEWGWKRLGRTDVEASRAGSAVLLFRIVGRQVHSREDRAQKCPVAEVSGQQVGVLALPAETGSRRKRLFHDRGCVNEDLDFATCPLNQPST